MSGDNTRRLSIEVKDVCINYRILNNTSVQKSFLKKKTQHEVFEAVKHISFQLREGNILGIIGRTVVVKLLCFVLLQEFLHLTQEK